MTSENKTYDILSVEDYTDKNGEVKSRFTRVGVAFDNKDGNGQSLIIPAGISLSGRITTKLRTSKEDAE